MNNTQYWLVILLGFLLIGVNGYLVLKLINKDIVLDLECPVPSNEIEYCDCQRDAYTDKLISCICYPGNKKIDAFNNLDLILNLSEVVNGTRGSN
jgi:hypothetical protein